MRPIKTPNVDGKATGTLEPCMQGSNSALRTAIISYLLEVLPSYGHACAPYAGRKLCPTHCHRFA
ncbi:MAG: hypothetical protein II400_05655 [Bacteroidaceae bacterium]|nr:hypothetical protein [Bacteroidaceae bacterium]